MSRTRPARLLALHGKMVRHAALVDGRLGLRDQLRAPHVAVPFGGAVNRDLDALLRRRVRGVFVLRRQRDVVGDRARAVDVVLVRPGLGGPGP
jgi:hypothetical protein